MSFQIVPTEQRPAIAQAVISRYLDGERIEDLATELGIARQRLYQIIVEQDAPGWQAAQVGAAIERLESAKTTIDRATDALDIARARESAKIAQWELERTCKRVYGSGIEVTGANGAPLLAADPLEIARRIIYALGQAVEALPAPIEGESEREV
jgi:hypothetical protein